MWLKYVKDVPNGNKKGAICWVDDDKIGQAEIDAGNAVRCIGPDGTTFEEAAPENVEAQLKAEEALKSKPKASK